MTELLLLRHGQTEGNELHRYVGCRTDEPLSERGREQCLQLAPLLPQVEVVYASPLLRARQTAALCFPEVRLQVVPGLTEFDFGAFEGKSAADMAQDERYRAWVDGWCVGACPGGDSRATFIERSNAALVTALHEAMRAGQRRIVVVAHGGTIMAAMHAFCHEGVPQDDYFGWQVRPCEGYQVAVAEEGEGLCFSQARRVSLASASDA